MKKLILILCIFILFSQVVYATQNRVIALGGETAMLPDDDTNIDLFPQHINKRNLLRLSRISTTTPDYAVITGKSGDKWGLYGGAAQQNDFLNIFRSLDANSAVKVGFAIGRQSQEDKQNNKEAAPGDASSTEKNSYYNLAIDGIYGVTKGDTEISVRGVFSYGPNAIAAATAGGSAFGTGPFGTYEISRTTAGTKTNSDGEGNQKVLMGVGSLRKPMKIVIFNKVFAQGSALYSSSSSSLSTGATKNEDSSSSTISLFGRALVFDEKKIGNASRLIYGIGAQGTLSRVKSQNKVNSTDDKRTTLSITGPQIRMGVESKLKYGIVRFGIARDFALLVYDTHSETVASGTNNDENSDKTFSIATTGTYSVSTGIGLEYNHLKIDVTLNRFFWVHGPQMVFDSQNGTIATSADVIYTF